MKSDPSSVQIENYSPILSVYKKGVTYYSTQYMQF
jgi:hypothetical protein